MGWSITPSLEEATFYHFKLGEGKKNFWSTERREFSSAPIPRLKWPLATFYHLSRAVKRLEADIYSTQCQTGFKCKKKRSVSIPRNGQSCQDAPMARVGICSVQSCLAIEKIASRRLKLLLDCVLWCQDAQDAVAEVGIRLMLNSQAQLLPQN